MTTSVVAVITDVVRDGKPVCGFAFNSTGRYACGAQMRARFIPRILKATPDSLLDGAGQFRAGENPRRHDAERKIRRPFRALGRHRHHRGRDLGRARQDRGQAAARAAGRALQRRQDRRRKCSAMSAAAGTRRARPPRTCRTRCARHLDAGYTMVKMKVGGMPLADDLARVEAVKSILPKGAQLAVDANSKFDRDDALAYARGLAPFELRWFEEPCDPLDFALLAEIAAALRAAAVDRRKSVLDPGRGKPGALRRPQAGTQRRHPDRSAAGLRHRAIRPHARHAGAPRLAARLPCSRMAATRCRWRSPPASASAARNPIPACSAISAASPTMPRIENGYITLSDRPGIGFEGQAAAVQDHAGVGRDLS